jgi:hypothetical protein
LPDIPAGFRYATVVTVIHRTDGVVDGRHRRMIAVCDDLDAEASEPSPASPAPPTQRWGASAKRSSNERVALVLLLLLSGLSLCEVPPREMWHEG